MIIVSDFDGILTPPYKLFYENVIVNPPKIAGGQPQVSKDLLKMKMISDHDLDAIHILQKNNIPFIIISKDFEVNPLWSIYRGIKFLYVKKNEKKWDVLKEHLDKIGEKEFVYIGDTINDFECLRNAKYGLYPSDKSKILEIKCHGMYHIQEVPVKGGQGVIEYIVLQLRQELGLGDFI